MTFLAAGHETTASAMTWAIFLLCKRPDVQKHLREEIHTHLPSISTQGAEITPAIIDNFPYLNAVCNEVLRVYPPVPLTLRESANATTILGHHIPKGTTVVLSPWAVNHSPELWGPDAHEFKPERWLAPGQANSGGAASN